MKDYKYFAFISYQRKDEKWAKWLQRKLEHYKLPTFIQENQSELKSKYIRPIFRDKTDITPGPLPKVLERALDESKYLIVICSPNAVKSFYVNEEIKTFIQQGKKDSIIPFIIDGVPHSDNSEHECFPAALLSLPPKDELNAANVNESGKEHAFIATVASMLNVDFKVLYDRFKHEQKVKRSIMILVFILLALLLYGTYEYKRSKVEYYSDFVDQYAIPHGIIKLTPQQAAKKNRMYRFRYKRIPWGEKNAFKWRPVSVEYVNSKGRPQDPGPDLDRASIMEIEYYAKSGEVSQINFCNRNGKVLYRHKYTSPSNDQISAIIDVKKSIEERGDGFAGSNSLLSQASQEQYSNITRYCIERRDGFVTKITYHYGNSYEADSSITTDENGISGKIYKQDSLGRVIEVTYLDRKGCIRCDKQGIAKVKYEYDKWGNISELSYWNPNDSLRICSKNWAIKRTESDTNGNLTKISYYDAQNQPCIEMSDNFSYVIQAYDESGNIIAQEYYGKDDSPILTNGKYHKVLLEYDNNGYPSCLSFIGLNDSLITCNDNYAGAYIRNDKYGNRLEIKMFNALKQIEKRQDGVAILKQEYDKDGNLIRQECFDENNKPCMCEYDYSILVNTYDENGRRIEGCYLDTLCEPHVSNHYMYSYIVNEYDVRGNWISSSYFDADKKPVIKRGGNHWKIEIKYNSFGLKAQELFYDTSGQLSLGRDGYCNRVFDYDDRGHLIRISTYGLNGELVICKFCKNAIKTIKYDEQCNLIEIAYYDANKELCLYKNAYSRILYSYDQYGNQIKQTFYDKTGRDVSSDIVVQLVFAINGNGEISGLSLAPHHQTLFEQIEQSKSYITARWNRLIKRSYG